MEKLLMDDKLESCYLSCKETFQKVQMNQKDAFMRIIRNQYMKMLSMGFQDVLMAYVKGDALTFVKAFNVFIEKNGKELILNMQKEWIKLYDDNQHNIDDVCDCYLKSCDKQAIEMTVELVNLVKNFITILSDASVQKQIMVLYGKVKQNLDYALKRLDQVSTIKASQVKKSNSSKKNSVSASKKPKQSKKSQKK